MKTHSSTASSATSGEVQDGDGRRGRSVRTRHKIVTALTELIRGGSLSPTAEQVAAQAGVGLRTVFRHFDDMESLHREINGQLEALMQPVIQALQAGGPWQQMLYKGLDLRMDLYDQLAAFHLATLAHRHRSAYLDQQLRRSATLQKQALLATLPAQVLHDEVLVEALVLCTSIDSWIRLRREQGLERALARAVVIQSVEVLIASSGIDLKASA